MRQTGSRLRKVSPRHSKQIFYYWIAIYWSMRSGSCGSLLFFSSVILLIVFSACTGCTTNPPLAIPQSDNTTKDPVSGTWNGFSATFGRQQIEDPLIMEQVEMIRLTIYPDHSFSYTSNFTIRNGTLIPTGKGNYVVEANETDTGRKYFHYDEDQDTLVWESRNLTIGFRRNARVMTADDLAEYNACSKERYEQEKLAASVTPRLIAQVISRGFGYDPTANIVYQMNGDIVLNDGIYDSVGIIIKYPDHDVYQIDVGGMGGANYTKKKFKIVLADRVVNQTPSFFIRLDTVEYPALPDNRTSEYPVYSVFSNTT